MRLTSTQRRSSPQEATAGVPEWGPRVVSFGCTHGLSALSFGRTQHHHKGWVLSTGLNRAAHHRWAAAFILRPFCCSSRNSKCGSGKRPTNSTKTAQKGSKYDREGEGGEAKEKGRAGQGAAGAERQARRRQRVGVCAFSQLVSIPSTPFAIIRSWQRKVMSSDKRGAASHRR